MSSFITIRLPRSRRKENAMNMGQEEGVSVIRKRKYKRFYYLINQLPIP